MKYQNFKSDFTSVHRFYVTDNGVKTQVKVPQHVRLTFFTEQRCGCITVERNGDRTSGCTLSKDGMSLTASVPLSRTFLGEGELFCEVAQIETDSSFPQSERTEVTPLRPGITLYAGQTDEGAEIETDALLGVIIPGAIRYDAAQTLTEEQQIQARTNIGIKGDVLTMGEGAISGNSISLGSNCIAGVKGWYYSSIDFQNNTLYLSKSQVADKPASSAGKIDSSFVSGYAVGNSLSISNRNHWDLSTITAIEGNKITVDRLPFTAIESLGRALVDDDYSVYSIETPDAGIIDIGVNSTVFGLNNKANKGAFAEGANNKAMGYYSHAEGRNTSAAYAAHSEGTGTQARGVGAHSEGGSTQAMDQFAHAEGHSSKATGNTSHAEGEGTTASGFASHSEGNGTVAGKSAAHAEGTETRADGDSSHAEGYQANAKGNYAHAEGYKTQASGVQAHAEGLSSEAHGNSSHAEGSSFAYGNYSHAEGNKTKAYGGSSHSEGTLTQVKEGANNAHAEGLSTQANASQSHAEGMNTVANGDHSHAEGFGTVTNNECEHAEGKYNKSNSSTRHSIGIGSSDSDRKNAVEVMENGDVYIFGVGGYDGTGVSQGTKSLQSELLEKVSLTPIAEAMVSLAARVDALESARGMLGNATAGNLDVSQLTKCLYPVVMKAHGVPAEANVPVNLPDGLPWDGIPAFVGQLYVNLDAAGGGLYYAVGTDSVNDWKQA